MYKKISRLVVNHYKLVLLASILVFALGAVLAANIGMDSKMDSMLPDDSKSIKSSEEFSKYFDSQDNVLVVVKGGSKESEAYIEALASRLYEDKLVNGLLYKVDLSALEEFIHLYIDTNEYKELEKELDDKNHPLSMLLESKDAASLSMLLNERLKLLNAAKQEKLKTTVTRLMQKDATLGSEDKEELFAALLFGDISQEKQSEYIAADSGNVYMMIIKPNIDMNDFINSRLSFFNGLQKAIDDVKLSGSFQVEAGFTGGALVQDNESDNTMLNNFFSTALLTFLLIIAFIVISFRRLILPMAAGYPLLLGAVLSVAAAYLVYKNLNMFSISFAVLLLGLGIDFAVHIISRYLEERAAGNDVKTSVTNTIEHTSSGMLVGALTTAVAFFTFLGAEFKAFTQMGVISGIGIAILCITMTLVMPSIIMLLDNKRKENRALKDSEYKFLRPIGKAVERRPMAVVICFLILAVLLTGNVLNSEIKTDMSKLYPQDMECLKWLKVVEKEFGYNPTTLQFMVSSEDELRRCVDELSKRNDVDKVESILQYLPEDQEYKLSVIKKLNSLLSKSSNSPDLLGLSRLRLSEMELNIEKLPEDLKKNFMGKEGRLSVEVVPRTNIWEAENFNRLEAAIREASGNSSVGMPAVMNEVSSYVSSDILRISSFCFAALFIILSLMFKSIKDTIIAVTPLFVTMYATLGLMPLLGADLNIFSMIAFPVLIGIGIDSSVHLLHRIKTSPDKDMPYVLSHTGKAVMMTTVTTLMGFGSLYFVNHPGLASFGLVTVIGMSLCLLLTLTMVPALYLVIYKPKGIKSANEIIKES